MKDISEMRVGGKLIGIFRILFVESGNSLSIFADFLKL